MNLKTGILQAWTSLWAQVSGGSGYEAAKTPKTRSTIDLRVQNAKQDIDKVTRLELIKKARYLYRNSPIIRGLVERLVTFTIGTGLHPIPMTSDPVFNKAALAAFKGWAKNPDLESRMSFETLQSVLFRAMLVDGDIFTLDTYGPSGRPRLQSIESQDITHRIKHMDDPDGIELDANGRPVFYVWKEDTKLPAEMVNHFYLPERAGQKRGISILAAVINTAHDVDDILALEKGAVKDGSSTKSVIKTTDGELPVEDAIAISVQEGNAENSIDEITRYYREVFDSETKVLRKGDEFDAFESNRPSPAWQGFMDFLCQTICFGTGLPPSLLLGNKIGGADTRRELATAQRVIEQWQQILSARLQQIYEYVILEQVSLGFLRNPPLDWREARWQTPPKLTVDAGRQSSEDREDLKMGLTTFRDYYDQYGLNWREQLRQKAEEAAELNKLAEEFDIDRAEITLLDPNELSAMAGIEDPSIPSEPIKIKVSDK